MKKARNLVLAALFTCHGVALANPSESWTPKVDFHLEDADFAQTLAWVSGWSYALTAVGKEQAAKSSEALFCLPNGGNIESRVMLEALNKEFRGQRVTSEQASALLLSAVKKHYVCD